jgi:hypothetical protein
MNRRTSLQLVDMTVVNIFVLLTSCGAKMTLNANLLFLAHHWV